MKTVTQRVQYASVTIDGELKSKIGNTIPSAGLGLSMAQKLLKVMYGTITVKSLKGKGTKVETGTK